MAAERSPRSTGPARAFLVGPAPLRTGRPDGPLARRTVAVKDVFALTGHTPMAGCVVGPVGPEPAATDAIAVSRLLDAGADVIGLVVTDELTWSLFGTNPHHGTPENAAAPGRVPGGSSSGSAAAVAVGAADIGLGTDTGGSIRVPASFCGLYGVRPTWGRVPTGGAIPLAPSLDTVGWMTREPELLRTVAQVLLAGPADPAPVPPRRAVVAKDALAVADPGVARVVLETADLVRTTLGEDPSRSDAARATLAPPDLSLAETAECFRVLQAGEVRDGHGSWLADHIDELGPGVSARARFALGLDRDQVRRQEPVRADIRDHLLDLTGDGTVLVVPAAPSIAPRPEDLAADADGVRPRMLALTAACSLAGLPCVVVPRRAEGGLPAGVGLIGPPGGDEALVDLVVRIEEARRGRPSGSDSA